MHWQMRQQQKKINPSKSALSSEVSEGECKIHITKILLTTFIMLLVTVTQFSKFYRVPVLHGNHCFFLYVLVLASFDLVSVSNTLYISTLQ